MNDNFYKLLICPVDKNSLIQKDSYLVCESNHKYPIVNGVPVILLGDACPTLWVSRKSWEVANNFIERSDLVEPYFIETLGLSNEERTALKEITINKPYPRGLEAIVTSLLGAACGNLYKGIKCDLTRLPIPTLPLSKNSGLLLDIGCNWGRWSIAASRHGFNVVGLDPSLGAVIVAKEICQYLGINANFVCADSRYLPFCSEKFDVVFSYSVLQHFSKEDVATSLKEIHRVLQQGGLSLIQMANIFGIRSLYHQLKRNFRKPVDFDVRYWKPDELTHTFNLNVGSSKVYADCFLGLGIQYDNNTQLLYPAKRFVAVYSKILKTLERRIPSLSFLADSLYVESIKRKSH